MALSKNCGFCKGNNIGFEHSKGIYIVLLNNDTYLSRTWFEELVKTMDSDSSIGVCQSRIVDFEKKHTLYGNFLGIYEKRKIGKLFKIEGDLFEGAFYASGTAIIIRALNACKIGQERNRIRQITTQPKLKLLE